MKIKMYIINRYFTIIENIDKKTYEVEIIGANGRRFTIGKFNSKEKATEYINELMENK